MTSVEPAWVFLHQDGEGVNARVARCADQALREGPMGRHVRAAFYKHFVSCDWSPPLEREGTWKNLGLGIETLFSSCAIFCRAVLHWSGRYTKRPGKMGQAVVGGWLEGLHVPGRAWMTRKDGDPRAGDVFVREYNTALATGDIHVGVLLDRIGTTRWRTAEGGGGTDGTMCRIEERDLAMPDSMGRIVVGWWRPERMDGFVSDADTDPCPPPESDR